ncbi:MAG TPA: hypothetical protein VHA82_24060 [Ramlibacter sp.]|uniref:hypothetical protein n=1 Tax=Ramlibacter sp. TaxID=1917967 RepID=UPI002C5B5847|nr:hypothetical protein [Ramlibacter sp.]HVZ46903.1 hypothetical protein [Ramlibacter sp.]
MSNLTLSVDDKLLRAARIRAVKEGTSVNEICRKALEHYVGADSATQRVRRFDELMAAIDSQQREASAAGSTVPAWEGRDALYDEVLSERMPGLFAAKAVARRPAKPLKGKT